MTDGAHEAGYRQAMARLASGVTVVTARSGRLDLGMTATSVVSASLDPPTVLFCVHEDARLAEAVQDEGRWAVSILSEDAAAAADWLASPGRPAIDQFGRVPHHRGELTGAVLLDQSNAWLECRTEWTRPAGSHLVVVGQVLRSALAPRAAGGLVHQHGRIRTVGNGSGP